jgi:hypothetical protein
VKWLVGCILLLLGGGVAAAAFLVPSNAAVVNGSAISQETLNSDVSAIAGSPEYQCYLNSEAYLSSNGSQAGLPPVAGAGQGQNPGDNPTANTAFVATYLDTEVGHQIVLQLAARRDVTATQAQQDQARTDLTHQISAVMAQVAQTAQGQNPRFSCGAVTKPLTGTQVLDSLPASFVDSQVAFVATASALQEDLAGVGSSERDLMGYYERHRSEFDTVCFNAAEYSSEASANQAQAAIDFGTPFSQIAGQAEQAGTISCNAIVAVANEVGVDLSKLSDIAVGKASAPISVNGSYIVLELSRRTPTPYASAKSLVSQAVQGAGAQAAQVAITAKERRSTVSIDPRYGTWHVASATVLTPLPPQPADVLNASANKATLPVSTSPFSG